ncbi:MAG TPA: 7-cyano-7-deazaguanine synthase QueC [Phycisphaerales bacterium]|nr:7-cyano-7-deazaguanine synthase QueC [Phycisphaerales bacterium]
MSDSHDHERAVVLVSGGLDSATVLGMAVDAGYRCTAISFDYGQRHRCELRCAATVCHATGVVDHRVIELDPTPLGGSTLTDGRSVPRPESATGISQEQIPDTYVPARNTIFLSMALGLAEGIGACHLFIGVNAVDYSGYPDCRGGFIEAFEAMANLATKVGVEHGCMRVHAPLLHMTKGEIIRTGLALGVDYAITSSCYDPSAQGRPCRKCESCVLRAKGFEEAGVDDPLLCATR